MKKQVLFLAAATAAVSVNAQSFMVDGFEAVDLGLNVLWATCNVGAKNPQDAGNYFAWGETKSKDDYTQANYLKAGKYSSEKTVLDPDDDAATQNMSAKWRMPSYDDENELRTKCLWVWTDAYKGIENAQGMIVYAPKKAEHKNTFDYDNSISVDYDVNADTHIFLPAKGNSYKADGRQYGGGWNFWTNMLTWDDNNAYCLSYNYTWRKNAFYKLYCGLQVRGVCEKSAVSALKNVSAEKENVYKTFENGQIVIVKNGVKYNLAGQKL